MSQGNLSQSVSAQTDICQTAEDKAFIAPYLETAKKLIKTFGSQPQTKKDGSTRRKSSNRKATHSTNGANNNKDGHRSSNGKSKSHNRKPENSDGGKKQQSPLLSQTDFASSPSKRGKRVIDCLSLSVNEDDLECYDFSQDEIEIAVSSIAGEKKKLTSEGDEDRSSSSSSEELRKIEVKNDDSIFIQGKVYSDYKENNKNGKKVRQPIDLDSDDEATDDGTEAHVTCLACGKYNQKKSLYTWVQCNKCHNWYHQNCTPLWRTKPSEIEKSNFICRDHDINK